MARETQGLQIALIVFVVLSIILAVTTYLFFRSYTEAAEKAQVNLMRATKQEAAARDRQETINQLKELLGFPITETPEAITEAAKADMDQYAANLTEDKRAYRTVLEHLDSVVQERNSQLADARAAIQELQSRNEMLEAVKEPQIEEQRERADSAEKDLAAERGKFEADRKRLEGDQATVASELDKVRKAGEATLVKAREQLAELDRRVKEVVHRYNRVKGERDTMVSETFQTAQGEVRWVNQRSRNVYVDLGWADSLPRQTTFGVYDADARDLTKTGKKASIEVTQILGPHLAEARIVDDRVSNPVMPGDRIHTPVWSPGVKRHFVFIGFIDMDRDGQSDEEMLYKLIETNGGVVDARRDASGKRIGELTVNTRYMVMGKQPSAKSSAAALDDYSAMLRRGEELQIEKIGLGELLDQMGWKSEAPSLQYGAGGEAVTFGAVRPETGIRRVSNGNVSDLFRERQPPGRSVKIAY